MDEEIQALDGPAEVGEKRRQVHFHRRKGVKFTFRQSDVWPH